MSLTCIHNRAANQRSSKRVLSTVTANISGNVREDSIDGRDYWVVPVRMMREGVLNGSGGPVLYELDDMEHFVSAWDMKPVVVNHPTTKNGSAASKQVLEKSGVGFLLNNEIDGSFHIAEVWIDQRKADKVDPRIRSAIKNGIQMEVSTGLFADRARKKGKWNGERFNSIARNYRPDHLALLPDMVGACSLAQGCGLLTANQAIPLKRMKRIQDVVNRLWKGKPLGNCSCRNPKGASSMKKNSTRTVRISANAKRLIDRIIGDGSGNWSEEDRSVLRKMDEAALKKIAAGRRQIEKLKSSAKSAEKLANTAARRRREKKRQRQEAERKAQLRNARSKNRRPCDQDDDDEAEPIRNSNVFKRIKTVDDALRIMPKPIRTMLSNGLTIYRQQRKQLVKLVMNSEGNKFSKEELMKMDDNTLNKLAAIANTSQQDGDDEGAPFSFFGQQGVVATRNSELGIDEEPLELPSTFITKNKKDNEEDED